MRLALLLVLAVLGTLGEPDGGRKLLQENPAAASLVDLHMSLVQKVVGLASSVQESAMGLVEKLAHLNVTELLAKATEVAKQAASKVDVDKLAQHTNTVAGVAARVVDGIVEHAAGGGGARAIVTSMGALPARQAAKDNGDGNTSA